MERLRQDAEAAGLVWVRKYYRLGIVRLWAIVDECWRVVRDEEACRLRPTVIDLGQDGKSRQNWTGVEEEEASS